MPRWTRPWHGREDEIVQAYLDGWRTRRIYDEFQISNRALFGVLESKGVMLRGFPPELKYDHAAIVTDYLAGMTLAEIVGKYNLPHYQVLYPIFKKAGIKATRTGGPKPLSMKPWNADYFNGRTEDVAYWAGFLIADGSIINDGGNTWVLSLTLGEKDIEHLRTFCDAIGVSMEFIKPQETHYREKHYTLYRISVYHQSLPDTLKAWGITPNKTYDYVAPQVDRQLLPAFLRGWADGDGHITHGTRGTWTFGITGNRDGITWYGNALRSIGYTGHIGGEMPEGKAWGRLRISGLANVRQVASLLKTDDFCLRRKWDKVSEEDK